MKWLKDFWPLDGETCDCYFLRPDKLWVNLSVFVKEKG